MCLSQVQSQFDVTLFLLQDVGMTMSFEFEDAYSMPCLSVAMPQPVYDAPPPQPCLKVKPP